MRPADAAVRAGRPGGAARDAAGPPCPCGTSPCYGTAMATRTGLPQSLLMTVSVALSVAGFVILFFTALDWRGLIGWGLLIAGLVLATWGAVMKARAARSADPDAGPARRTRP